MKRRMHTPTGRQCPFLYIVAVALLATACAPLDPTEDETDPVSPYAEEALDAIRVNPDTAATFDCNGNGLVDRLEVHPFGFSYAETHGPVVAGVKPVQALAANIDGNRRPELIALNAGETDAFDGSLSFTSGWFAVRDIFFPIPPVLLSDFRRPRCFVTGHFNADRAIDIAVLYDSTSGGDPRLATLYNAGDGTFPLDLVTVEPTGFSSARCLTTADLDGDGDQDLLATLSHRLSGTDDSRPVVAVRRYDGAAGLAAHWETFGLADVGNIPFGGPGSVTAADVDGDNDRDVILTAQLSPGVVVVHINRGDYFTGDIDARDLVVFTVGDNPAAVAAGDLNGDERIDLVVSNRDSDNLSLLLNAGDGEPMEAGDTTYFVAEDPIPVGDEPGQVVMDDLDGDGDLDLAVANTGDDTVTVLINQGDANFYAPVTFSVGSRPHSLVAAHFWQAAFPDLLTANLGSNNMSVLTNQTQPAVSPDCNGNLRPDSCDIASGASTDEDGNGIPDECRFPVLHPGPDPRREPLPVP